MKNFKSFSFIFLALSLFFVCCGREKASSENEESGENLTTEQTSLAVTKATEVMNLLQKNEIAQALDLLYVLNSDGEPVKLSDQEKEAYTERFEMFPVLSYKLEKVNFDSWDNNLIDFSTEFYKAEKQGEPNRIAVVFNPFYKNGEWYMSLKDRK